MTSPTRWLVVMATIMAIIRLGESFLMEKTAKHIDSIEHIAIHHVTPTHIRHKRTADGNPEELHFELHMNDGQKHELRLKRSRDHGNISGMRVYRIRNSRLAEVSRQEIRENDKNKEAADAGFFTNEDRTSLFRLRRARKRQLAYDLDGTILLNGREYIVSPRNEYLEVDSSARAHRLCRLLKKLDYGMDGLEDDETAGAADRTQTRRSRTRHVATPYRSSRVKRQIRRPGGKITNYVETVFYCDFSCYSQFQKYARAQNESLYGTIRAHFTFVAQGMNLRYESITSNNRNQQIIVTVQNLIVLDDPAKSEFTEFNKVQPDEVDARNVINSFRTYVRGGNAVPRADHWMLFTGYDLSVSGNRGTIGVAYLNRICTGSSVSIIEDFFSGLTAQIATHELGHTLGSEHDSRYSRCSDRNHNIMAGVSFFPQNGTKLRNPWLFSSCSTSAITRYINGRDGYCLQNKPTLVNNVEKAGQLFDADNQCRLSQGPESYFCRGVQQKRGYDAMCVRLYCFLPDEAPNCSGGVALDGTTCGDGRWCNKGSCAYNQDAPRILGGDACPQGDDPLYGCTIESCNILEARTTFCCRTCGVTSPPAPAFPQPGPGFQLIPIATRAPPPPEFVEFHALTPAPTSPAPPRQNRYRPRWIFQSRQNNPQWDWALAPPRTLEKQPEDPRKDRDQVRTQTQSQRQTQRQNRSQSYSRCTTELCRCFQTQSFNSCLFRSWYHGK